MGVAEQKNEKRKEVEYGRTDGRLGAIRPGMTGSMCDVECQIKNTPHDQGEVHEIRSNEYSSFD